MRSFFLFIFFIVTLKMGVAQTIPTTPDFKSPEVAAFNKDIETPVSYYTGVPNISIPLFQIDMKGVAVPVSLKYNAGGIRVDQEATWVGLGWSLDYGGEISRKVRGTRDERNFYTSSSISSFMAMPNETPGDLQLREEQIAEAKYATLPVDFMPDEFYYSCLGYSGRFMFNQTTQKFLLFPKEDISVNAAPGSATFPYWTLRLPNGVSADFGKDGVTSETNLNNLNTNTTSSWLVKCIRNNLNDSILYNYEAYSYNAWKITGETVTIGVPGGYSDNLNTAVPEYSYQDVRVKEIDFPNGKATFISAPRNDMPSNSLTEIDVTNTSGARIKTILFYYSYFTGSSFDILPALNSIVNSYVPTAYKFQRLRLDSVQITGPSAKPVTYRLDYYVSSQMPSKYSFAQDHFGFYNGKSNTGIYSFIPNINPPSTEGGTNGFPGGDRRVNPAVSNNFSLHTIQYPEGGKSEFIYESNTANLGSIPPQLLYGYQDDNIRDTSIILSFSGWSRSSFYPSPDSVASDGTRYFIRNFRVSNNGYPAVGLGWNISTTYGISTAENNTPYYADNVYFKLESIDGAGNAFLVKGFSTTPAAPSSSAPYARTGTDNSIFQLLPGNYRMTAKIVYLNPVGSAAENQPYNGYFQVSWRELDSTKMMINVGGLRIKSINYYTEDAKLARRKSFSYNYLTSNIYNIPNFTSGRIVSLPKYYQFQNLISVGPQASTCLGGFYLAFFSNSILPLETTGGAYAGYQSVDEYDVNTADSSQMLRTNYSFSFQPSYFAPLNPSENMAMWEPQEWTRGKMLSKKYFKGSNIIKQEDYSYYSLSPNLPVEDNVPEINTDFISWQSLIANNPQWVIDYNLNPESPNWGPLNPNTYPPDFYDNSPSYITSTNITNMPGYSNVNCPTYYYDDTRQVPLFLHYTGFDKPLTRTVTLFDDRGGALSTIDSFFYEGSPTFYELTRTKTVSSKGDVLETINRYPNNFSTTSPFNEMIQQHNIGAVVETQKNKNGNFLELQHTNYADWGNNIVAPISIQDQVLTNPVDPRIQFASYDNKGNPTSFSKTNDYLQSVLWDYNQQYPIAKVVNASLADISYTSFEAGGTGSWTTGGATPLAGGITGSLYYSLNNDISRSGLNPSTNYIVSYWSSNGSYSIPGTTSGYPIQGKTVTIGGVPWTYYEHLVTGQSSIQVRGIGGIDELRLYPASAQMTTYTYTPLIGMTSQCDMANRITYYFYDGLGRLSYLKDQDGNIVKTYQYHYWNQ